MNGPYEPSFLARWWPAWREAESNAFHRKQLVDNVIAELLVLQEDIRRTDPPDPKLKAAEERALRVLELEGVTMLSIDQQKKRFETKKEK